MATLTNKQAKQISELLNHIPLRTLVRVADQDTLDAIRCLLEIAGEVNQSPSLLEIAGEVNQSPTSNKMYGIKLIARRFDSIKLSDLVHRMTNVAFEQVLEMIKVAMDEAASDNTVYKPLVEIVVGQYRTIQQAQAMLHSDLVAEADVWLNHASVVEL